MTYLYDLLIAVEHLFNFAQNKDNASLFCAKRWPTSSRAKAEKEEKEYLLT